MDGEGLPETPLLLTLVGVLERALLVLAFFLKTLIINNKTYIAGGDEVALDTILISIMACILELLTMTYQREAQRHSHSYILDRVFTVGNVCHAT